MPQAFTNLSGWSVTERTQEVKIEKQIKLFANKHRMLTGLWPSAREIADGLKLPVGVVVNSMLPDTPDPPKPTANRIEPIKVMSNRDRWIEKFERVWGRKPTEKEILHR